MININPPEIINGIINLPASKSISNRILIIDSLSNNKSEIHNIANCNDSDVMNCALKELPYTIDINAAGTSMRFLTAFLSVTNNGEHIITGSQRMKNRPIKILVDSLKELGANIEYLEHEGYPPLKIIGKKLQGKTIYINGDISSQYISALLMIGPIIKNGLKIVLQGEITSKPYIDMTINLMQQFNINIYYENGNTIIINPSNYNIGKYIIENDWSAASYWYEIVALSKNKNTKIILPNLYKNSLQGDNNIYNIFNKLGVITTFENNNVILTKSNNIVNKLDIDLIKTPDLAQTIIVTCCMLGVHFDITGLHTLKIKETDRILALQNELYKLGYIIKSKNNNELIWNGETCKISSKIIDTYDDHRMAMSFAPCSLIINNIKINNPEVIIKSYPNYWDDLYSVGFKIKIEGE